MSVRDDAAVSLLESECIIMDSVRIDSRSAPTMDIGNCLSCIFHMNLNNGASDRLCQVRHGSSATYVCCSQFADLHTWRERAVRAAAWSWTCGLFSDIEFTDLLNLKP
jgi:hypothetical protein